MALPQEVKIPFSFSRNGLEVDSNESISISIEFSDNYKMVGLSKTRLQTKCELRCRQAGIKIDIEAINLLLDLNVTVLQEGAFSVRLEFVRHVLFTVGKVKYWVTTATWSNGFVGIHGNDPEFIVGSVDQLLDNFLNEFLKANPKK